MNDDINPSHYRRYPIESIDMMESIFGTAATLNYCIITAFKYRMRLGHKDNFAQDLAKEEWYLNKAKELTEKLNAQPANV